MEFYFENNDILKDTYSENVIPDHCLNFSESALYVIESTENTFNDLFKSIGINELAVYESTGMEIVYEDGALKTFIDGAINALKEFLGKIKGWFDKVISKIQAKIKEAKERFGKKLTSSISAKAIESKKVYGKTHEYPMEDYCFSNAKTYIRKVVSEFDNVRGLDAEAIKNRQDELTDDIISQVTDINSKKASEMVKELKKKMLGREIDATGSWVISNYKDMVKYITGDSMIKEVKKDYLEIRKIIDDQISNIKKFRDDKASIASAELRVMKSINSILVSVKGAKQDVYRAKFNNYVAILGKVILGTKKLDVTTTDLVVRSESTYVSTQTEMIESAFNW